MFRGSPFINFDVCAIYIDRVGLNPHIFLAIAFKTAKKTMFLCHSIDCFKNINFWADLVHFHFLRCEIKQQYSVVLMPTGFQLRDLGFVWRAVFIAGEVCKTSEFTHLHHPDSSQPPSPNSPIPCTMHHPCTAQIAHQTKPKSRSCKPVGIRTTLYCCYKYVRYYRRLWAVTYRMVATYFNLLADGQLHRYLLSMCISLY